MKQISGTFSSHATQTQYPRSDASPSRCPAPWHPPFCLLSLWTWLLRTSHQWKQYLSLCDWLISLSAMSSRFACIMYSSHSAMSNSLQPDGRGLQPARLLCPWDSPGKKTGVGCCALLQGIFPTQGSNPGLPHCRWIFLPFQLTGKPHLCYNVMISFLFIAEYNTMLWF